MAQTSIDRLDVAVVGAGPFGLSVAAWLDDRRTRVFGSPMRTWRTLMPPDLELRSAWEETSLSARGGRGDIDEWAATAGERREPIPLELFLRYADWFRETYVAEHDPADVTHLEPLPGGGYRLATAAGETFQARNVVLAVGVTPFANAPEPFAGTIDGAVRFAVEERDVERYAGQTLVVVGGGQAAFETGLRAARAGADVEVLARSRVHWFGDREPHYPRGAFGRRLFRLAYPVVGFGPPPINRLVTHPDLFARLPYDVRRRLTARLLRPGTSRALRDEIERTTRITQGVSVTGLEQADGRLRLALSDGTVRDAEAVLLATGYRFALDRLGFLAPELRARIRTERGGWPVLDRCFRSTDPGLFFVGYPAEGRFGPLSRFVLGADFTARRVRAALSS